MEPLNDDELKSLLRVWKAPPAPPGLEQRLFGRHFWRWLLTGSVRVPVPVLALAALALLGFFALRDRPAVRPRADQVNFSQFQPVEELRPRIIRSAYENH